MKFFILIIFIYINCLAIDINKIEDMTFIKEFKAEKKLTLSFYQARKAPFDCHACSVNILVFFKRGENILKIQDLGEFGSYGYFNDIEKIKLGKEISGFVFTDRFIQNGYTTVSTNIFMLESTNLLNVLKFENYSSNNGNINLITNILEKTEDKENSVLTHNNFTKLQKAFDEYNNLNTSGILDYELFTKIYPKVSINKYYDLVMYQIGIDKGYSPKFDKYIYTYDKLKKVFIKRK